MNRYILLIILLPYIACKKGDDSGRNNWPRPMIKTMKVGNSLTTFSYDTKGRILKAQTGEEVMIEYTYSGDSIYFKTTDLVTSAVDKVAGKLDAYGMFEPQDGTEYKYDASGRLSEVVSPPASSGWQTRKKNYYSSATGLLDSTRKTESRLLQTRWLETILYTYYTDVDETHGNENMGMGFNGKNDLHPLKHSETWIPIAVAPYRKNNYTVDRQYGYDDAGRIVVQDHKEKRPDNTNVQWRTAYTYY